MRCAEAYNLNAINRVLKALPVNLEMSAPFVRLATAVFHRRVDLSAQPRVFPIPTSWWN